MPSSPDTQGNAMPHIQPLPDLMLEPLVRAALLEDLGRAGDITTDAIVPPGLMARADFVARQPGVVAGLALARLAVQLLAPGARFAVLLPDGSDAGPGSVIATAEGPAAALLTAERTALNFLCRLSGIATVTRAMARAVGHTGARITCTRKTTPGLRAVEKYAVRVGGGSNHRFGLDDAMLIKDNHVALAGGVAQALALARSRAGHLVKIELEVDTLGQLDEALAAGVDAVLLDNMTPGQLAEAVRRVGGRAVTEASGRVTPETAPGIAATGVDLIAVGWLTHSAPIMDIGLDIVRDEAAL
jgi:nicotinate-nucleotide pyrophosphorylase (carboxylating)